jgi:hypothetical protein
MRSLLADKKAISIPAKNPQVSKQTITINQFPVAVAALPCTFSSDKMTTGSAMFKHEDNDAVYKTK